MDDIAIMYEDHNSMAMRELAEAMTDTLNNLRRICIKDMDMPNCCDECPIYSRTVSGCILASYGCVDRYNYDISVRPEWCPLTSHNITDKQAIEHLQASGWMQNHDREMYESGLKEQLADDSDSYDNLIPCEDTISRQAAIDAFDCTDELIVGGSANAQNVMNYINKVIGKIEELPSAQSKVVKCKKCRYVYYDKEFDNYWCDRTPDAFMVEAEGFCKWGR